MSTRSTGAVYRSSRLLGLSVEPSLHGEKTYVAFLLQGGLGLPDREPYVSTEPGMQALRARYQRYIGRLLALAGFDRAERRAAAVMTLETALARSQATKEASAHDQNADSVWTRGDFARRAPGMDWSAFFKEAGLARQESFVVWQPSAATGLAAEVGSAPLEAWKDYLRFHLLDEYAEVLPRAYAEEARALHGAAVTGTPDETRVPAGARGDGGGDERRPRTDVRRALFPGRAEGPGAGDRGQCHRGAASTCRGGDVDVGGHQAGGAGQAAARCTSASATRSGGRTTPT